MGKLIAVSGMTLGYSTTITGSAPVATGSPSTTVKPEGKGAYKDGLSVTVPAGITDASSCVATGPTLTTIPTTALKVKADGTLVLREDDESALLSIPGLIGGVTACTIATKVVIDDAGQSTVRAE